MFKFDLNAINLEFKRILNKTNKRIEVIEYLGGFEILVHSNLVIKPICLGYYNSIQDVLIKLRSI